MFVCAPDIEVCPCRIIASTSTVLNLGWHCSVAVGFLGFEGFQSRYLLVHHLLSLTLV